VGVVYCRGLVRRTALLFALFWAVGLLTARPAAAQTAPTSTPTPTPTQTRVPGVSYHYVGNQFQQFSCGPDTSGPSCPSVDPAYTSYTTSDFLSATLTFDSPLPANLNDQDLRNFAGFTLILNDRHQTLIAPGDIASVGAVVWTDATGQIIGWSVSIQGDSTVNNQVSTRSYPALGISPDDLGLLAGQPPQFPYNYATSVSPGRGPKP